MQADYSLKSSLTCFNSCGYFIIETGADISGVLDDQYLHDAPNYRLAVVNSATIPI